MTIIGWLLLPIILVAALGWKLGRFVAPYNGSRRFWTDEFEGLPPAGSL